MLLFSYDSEWKPRNGWQVTTSDSADLAKGSKVIFEGIGDGGADSVLKVEGSAIPVGLGCVYEAETDSVTLMVRGIRYRVTRQPAPGSPSVKAVRLDSGVNGTGGSWTAEEGAGSVKDPVGPPPPREVVQRMPVGAVGGI